MKSDHLSREALSSALDCPVEAFATEPLRHSPRGYMADVYRVTIETGQTRRSVIMKTASSNPERRAVAERFGSYRNEQRFYSELNQDLPFRVPECYLNSGDRFLLLLEDLGDGGTIDTTMGASETQARDAIKTLAKIHGHFSQNPPRVNQGIRTGLTTAAQDMQTMVLDSLGAYSNHSRHPAVQLASQYAANSLDYVALFEQQDQVFTHLDFRLDNLRFLNELVVLDWGESTHAPVGFDLAGFLVTSLKSQDRQHWESDLLKLYGETIQSFELVQKPRNTFVSYQLALLPSLYLATLVLTQGDTDEGQVLLERNLSAIEDHYADISVLLG